MLVTLPNGGSALPRHVLDTPSVRDFGAVLGQTGSPDYRPLASRARILALMTRPSRRLRAWEAGWDTS